MKFGRSYYLTANGLDNRPVEVSFPITAEIETQNGLNAASNVAEISLYNLSQGNRQVLSINAWSKVQPYPITLRAGYVSQNQLGLAGNPTSLPIIFNGYIKSAYTEKSQSDLITRINALDNAELCNADGESVFPQNFSIAGGTPFDTMVRQVMANLNILISVGNVIIFPLPDPVGMFGRPFTGSVWQALLDLAGEVDGTHVYIQNGVVNMLTQNATLGDNNLQVLNSASGLLGIPKFMPPNIICSMVFEPNMTIGTFIDLQSSYTPVINGPCKIMGYRHSGVISGVLSGSMTTELTLLSLNSKLAEGGN